MTTSQVYRKFVELIKQCNKYDENTKLADAIRKINRTTYKLLFKDETLRQSTMSEEQLTKLTEHRLLMITMIEAKLNKQ